MLFRAKNLSDLKDIAEQWVQLNPNPVICLLNGNMGSGKTTFVKEICKALGISENISSPTFSLVNEYKTDSGKLVFHFDLYRVKDIEELYDIGFEEYLDSGGYVFIEWPEIGQDFYPDEIQRINISIDEDVRVFELS